MEANPRPSFVPSPAATQCFVPFPVATPVQTLNSLSSKGQDLLTRARKERLSKIECDKAWLWNFIETQERRLKIAADQLETVQDEVSKAIKERPDLFSHEKAEYTDLL